jgi:hypothetical protein
MKAALKRWILVCCAVCMLVSTQLFVGGMIVGWLVHHEALIYVCKY